jgi:hypothetical protein
MAMLFGRKYILKVYEKYIFLTSNFIKYLQKFPLTSLVHSGTTNFQHNLYFGHETHLLMSPFSQKLEKSENTKAKNVLLIDA